MALLPRLQLWSSAAAHVPARAAESRPVRVAIYRDLNVVEQVWQQLERHSHATVFQVFSVFQAWVVNIAGPLGVNWFVAVIHDGRTGQPLLLLPMVLKEEAGLKIIEGADLGIADFIGPVVACGFCPTQMEMQAAWRNLKSALPEADLLRLSKMPSRIGRSRNPLIALPNVNRMKLSNFKSELDRDWDLWISLNVPEKLRADIVARRRKLSKRGRLAFHTAQTVEEADTFFAAMLAQRQQRFLALGRSDILDDSRFQDFYRNLVQPGEPSSIAVMQALSVDDVIIAAGYGLIFNDSFHMIFPSFTGEGWRNYSPGMQLFLASMEWAASKGIKTYDFTIGGEAFKRDLGAEEFPLYEKLAALTPRGASEVYADRLRRFVRRNPKLAHFASSIRGGKSHETRP